MPDTTRMRQQFGRVADAFERARAMDAEACAEYLRTLAEGEPALADEVRSLLDHAGAADSRLDHPVLRAPEGVIVDRYRIIRALGAGGMGTVYLAEQLAPVRREVALKLIKLGTDSAAVLQRFQAERQALARMEHPGIAHIYDGGVAQDGRPYFAMELVRGQPVNEWCAAHTPSLAERLRVFLDICAAVQHAHQKGVIHRDLKPSNVLVRTVDGKPLPKVIDFGIAQALDASDEEHVVGIGTPAYMSPEQLQADPAPRSVDIRTDVYSLGVVLHEMTAGTHVLPERSSPPATDLAWIVHKATARAPEERYATVEALADEVRRWLHHEPVHAHPAGALYVLRKFARRHAVGLSAAIAISAAMVTGLAMAVWGLNQAREELFSSTVERGRLAGANGHLPEARQLLWQCYLDRPQSPQASWALRELLTSYPCQWTAGMPGVRSGLVASVDASSVVIAGAAIPPTIIDIATGGVRWQGSALPSDGELIPQPQRMELSPDRSHLALADDRGSVHLWSLKDGSVQAIPVAHRRGFASAVFLNHGATIATAGEDGRILLTDLADMQRQRVLADIHLPIRSLAADAQRGLLAAGTADGRILLWRDLSRDPAVIPAHGDIVFSLAFDPTGALLGSGSTDRHAALWSVATGECIRRVASDNGTVRHLVFDAHGNLYVMGWWRVAVLAPGSERLETVIPEGGWQLAIPAEGVAIAISNNDDSIRRWNIGAGFADPVPLPDGWTLRECVGGPAPLLTVRGNRVALRTLDGTAEWDEALPAAISAVTASSDGSTVAAGLDDHSVWARRAGGPWECVARGFEPGLPGLLALERSGDRAAFRITDNRIGAVRTADAPQRAADMAAVPLLPASANEQIVTRFSHDGALSITAERVGGIRISDGVGVATVALPPQLTVFSILGLADGRVALGTWTGPIVLLDPRTGSQQTLSGHSATVRSLAVHPRDPALLLSGSMDGTVRLWHLGLGRELQRLQPFRQTPVRMAGFGADGTRIIASSEDGRVCQWPTLMGDALIEGSAQYERSVLKGTGPMLPATGPSLRRQRLHPD